MNNTKLFISEVIAAAILFGLTSWVFELISNNPDIPAWNIIIRSIVFGVIYVSLSWLLRKKKDKK